MVKIGLEIHGYLSTKKKLFCNCDAIHGAKHSKPNTHICPICTGQPGTKPLAPNKSAIDKTIAIGLILGCKINPKVVWQRKHYDWPDLPKGYQNTISGPYAVPVGIKGKFLKIGLLVVMVVGLLWLIPTIMMGAINNTSIMKGTQIEKSVDAE